MGFKLYNKHFKIGLFIPDSRVLSCISRVFVVMFKNPDHETHETDERESQDRIQ